MFKRAVILAGGKGTRLRPYTIVMPKPLMPVGDLPILEIIARQLKFFGFDHLTLTVNHQADIIKAYFGDGSKWNLKIDYSLEDRHLSTMGPLKLIKDLPDNFLVMNGDILTDLDFDAFYNQHINEMNLFTISSHHREEVSEYGVLEYSENNILSGFYEKPSRKYQVSMGIYMVNKKILNYIPANVAYGFDSLMIDLLKAHKEVKVLSHDCYWLDIGRPDDYQRAIDEFEEAKNKLLR